MTFLLPINFSILGRKYIYIYINIFTLTNVPLQLIGKALIINKKSVFNYNPT